MFNAQEQEIIKAGRVSGKSPAEIETAIRKYRSGYVPPATPEPSVAKDLAIGAAKGAGSSVKGIQDSIAASIPSLLAGPIASAIPAVKDRINDLIQPLTDLLQGKLGLTEENLKAKNDAQRIGKGVEIAAELATPFVTSKLAAIAPSLIKASEGTAAKAVSKAQDIINPKASPAKALAQIGQGKTDSLSSVAQTLQNIDTKGVKTYKDLLGRIDENIPKFAEQVDTSLSQDPKKYPLAELVSIQKTNGGKTVTTDYVSRALRDLKDLYAATGDDAAKANIEEVISHASTEGITRKEVNDISRVYGQEFGTKAFSKLGEPLTGTNAQAFENTRKGLKEVARQGLGGEEAQALDRALSALYDTRTLVQKNVEAVQRLQQRIQDRGLVEKAGYYVSKYADILTGGSLRGFIGGLLPRGAGYKVMNAVDIENALRGNLDVIEKALASKSDDELMKILRKAEPVFKSGPKTQTQ